MNDSSVHAFLSAPMKPERAGALSATETFIWRSLQKLKIDPTPLLFDAIVSVASMLIFTYLFGGAIGGSPKEYVQFLLPGILLMTVLPMTAYTGAGLCNDIATGVFDRFRTLGFWQPAAVVGALFGDIPRYLIAVLAVMGTGLLIEYRPEGGALGMGLGILLVVFFAFSVGWIFAAVGVIAKKAESISQNSMIFIYTSIFCSNIFVQTATLPGWLQVVVNINPTSHVVVATRGLMDGTATTGQLSVSVLICMGIILAFAPFTFWLYRKKHKN